MRAFYWVRAVLSTIVMAGCAVGVSEAPSTNTREIPAAVIRGELDERALTVASEYVGRYDAETGRLTFSRANSVTGGVVRPGYGQSSSNVVSLQDNGTAVYGGPTFSGGACGGNQLCAVVTLTNDSSVTLRDVRVEIADLTGGATLAETNAVGTNVPSYATSAGGWNYGTIAAAGSTAHNWKIDTLAGASFSFRVVVWASFTRTSYTASDLLTLSEASNVDTADAAWSDSAPAWRDACLVSGSTIISGTSSFTSATRTPQFPSAIYGSLIQTDGWTNGFQITTAGTFGIANVTGESNDALSGGSAQNTTFYPFWDALDGSSGTVCAALDPSSTSPNQRYVVTWKDMAVRGYTDSRVTFSVVLQEKTDNVWFLYHQWRTGADACSSDGTGSDAVRGAGATVGVRGNSGTEFTEISRDVAFLPARSAAPCPGAGAYYALIATPVNP